MSATYFIGSYVPSASETEKRIHKLPTDGHVYNNMIHMALDKVGRRIIDHTYGRDRSSVRNTLKIAHDISGDVDLFVESTYFHPFMIDVIRESRSLDVPIIIGKCGAEYERNITLLQLRNPKMYFMTYNKSGRTSFKYEKGERERNTIEEALFDIYKIRNGESLE